MTATPPRTRLFDDARRAARDFVRLAATHKAYWMLPLVIVLGLTAFLAIASRTAPAAIYRIF